MSLKSFFRKIWEGIKKAFEGLAPDLKEAIHIGVIVVDNMKTFIEGEAADVLTAIIPGQLDDVIKERLRAFLPKILIEMKLAEQCSELTDPSEIVACAIKTLQQIGGDCLAVMIAEVASDGKLTWDDSKAIIKWYNDNVKKAA
jgi:hypothetical protein